MQTEVIKCEVADHIAVVTMDAPPVNAQNRQFHEETMAVFDALGDRDDVRAGRRTAVEACQACLDRIASEDEHWRAFTAVYRDDALKRAGELIKQRVPSVDIRFYSGALPFPDPIRNKAISEIDVAIGCTAD